MRLLTDNRQDRPLPEGLVEKIKLALLAGLQVENLSPDVEISLSFVDEEEIQDLNRAYRNKDQVTDVLSFPLYDEFVEESMLGDIVLCVKRAEEQAEEYGHSLERELIYLSMHSLFHLLGYDHMNPEEKKEMRDREKETLKSLEVQMKSLEQLIEMTLEQKEKAYAPYSNFRVGAVVEMEDGSLYGGCNIENAAYGVTRCAEQVAILKAVEDGKREIKRLAVTGDDHFTYPCGVCRQMIREFGKEAQIIVADSVTEYRVHTLDEILPYSFGPEALEGVKEDV